LRGNVGVGNSEAAVEVVGEGVRQLDVQADLAGNEPGRHQFRVRVEELPMRELKLVAMLGSATDDPHVFDARRMGAKLNPQRNHSARLITVGSRDHVRQFYLEFSTFCSRGARHLSYGPSGALEHPPTADAVVNGRVRAVKANNQLTEGWLLR
jgi:hypothetical protein